MSWDCGLRYMFSVPPALQQQQPGGGVSGGGVLHGDKEDLSSRLEMVQRLAKDGCRFLHQSHSNKAPADRTAEGDEAVRVCLRERGRDVLVLRRVSSERRPAPPSSERRLNPSSSTRGGGGGGGGGGRTADERQRRFALVAGTPDKILDHLLSQLDLDAGRQPRGTPPAEEPDTLLEDFLLTYLVFMSTSDLCHALLGHYVTKRRRGKEDGKDALDRKRKVLHLVSQWSTLRSDFMRDDEHVKMFMKTLYRYVLDDLYQHPGLEQDVRELHSLIRLQRSHTTDEYSPNRKSKAPFHQLSPKENGLRSRGTQQRETKEVLCQVYVSMDSYMSMKVHAGVEAQEMIHTLAERMDTPHQDLVLVAVTYPEGRLLLQPHDRLYSDSLAPVGRLHVCRKHLSEVAVSPVTDNSEQQQRTGRLLSMNTWDVAVALTNFDWTIFSSIHEQELVYFIFSRHAGSGHTAALEQLLQRCNEVQLWVATEVLLCPALCKRVQLIKKFIKIAAHCKAQKNLNCLFAIIMGLNTAAVSRLSLTWEKVPGKFKKLFSELETMTDPSLNHKAYRDSFKKMKAPKIPFLPLLLKDITFIHEGNKTFHDNLVNFEKLHMIADTVRLIRHCQTDHLGNGITEKGSADVSSYTDYLLIIDNQQTQFELSHRLEPRT